MDAGNKVYGRFRCVQIFLLKSIDLVQSEMKTSSMTTSEMSNVA